MCSGGEGANHRVGDGQCRRAFPGKAMHRGASSCTGVSMALVWFSMLVFRLYTWVLVFTEMTPVFPANSVWGQLARKRLGPRHRQWLFAALL